MPSSRVPILGVGVDAITMDQAAARIIELSKDQKAHYVVKPYVEFIERAVDEPEIKRILNDATLVLPDGVALAWAASYLNQPNHGMLAWLSSIVGIVARPAGNFTVLPERFGGTDFTVKLLQAAAQTQRRVFLVGSPKYQSITETAAAIHRLIPNINLVGTAGGNIANTAAEQRLCGQLKAASADIILIGMGFPRQELLMSRLVRQLQHGIMIGEGGSFDFDILGGGLNKAPAWVGRIGLEWFWRLLHEPSRIGRQLSIPRFMWRIYQHGRLLGASA